MVSITAAARKNFIEISAAFCAAGFLSRARSLLTGPAGGSAREFSNAHGRANDPPAERGAGSAERSASCLLPTIFLAYDFSWLLLLATVREF